MAFAGVTITADKTQQLTLKPDEVNGALCNLFRLLSVLA